MGKFFDHKAFAASIDAAAEREKAKPDAKETVTIPRSVFNVMLELPGKLALSMSAAIDAAHDAHEKRIAELEERLRIAEVKGMRYRGTWTPDEQYSPGDFVTDGGSMWHCYASTRGRPGEASKDWVLAVKKGRDGKDAR